VNQVLLSFVVSEIECLHKKKIHVNLLQRKQKIKLITLVVFASKQFMWGLLEQLWCQVSTEKLFLAQLVNNYPSMEHGGLKCLVFDLFTGLAGPVNIDTNGDRIADYSLLDMDPETYTFHVSATLTYTQLSSLAFRMNV
jgi:hypothetical protein